MPFKSRAQAAYMNIHKKELEAQGVDVDEFNQASKGLKLPKRVKRKPTDDQKFVAAVKVNNPKIKVKGNI